MIDLFYNDNLRAKQYPIVTVGSTTEKREAGVRGPTVGHWILYT